MEKRIYLSSPHMGGEERIFLDSAFESNWIAPLGENVDMFEREIERYVGVKYSAALVSGTAAIHLALKALGVDKDDIVFCSSLTFSASCNPIIYQGAQPVFIDSDEQTWNMCPKSLKKAFLEFEKKKKLPKAVIVVNLYGQSANYDELKIICDQYEVPIIEDAAESLGATYKGRQTGTLGKIGIFSFNGNKIITTSGGGMLVSNDEKIVKKAKYWATQSRETVSHYEHKELGFNYRLSNILAGIGRGQLKVLDQRIKQKKAIYEFYKEEFKYMKEIEMMPIADYGTSNYWLSVIKLTDKSQLNPAQLIATLDRENIESRHVWKPMHLQPYFKPFQFYTSESKDSISTALFNRGLCLPSDTKMTTSEMERVADRIKKLFKE